MTKAKKTTKAEGSAMVALPVGQTGIAIRERPPQLVWEERTEGNGLVVALTAPYAFVRAAGETFEEALHMLGDVLTAAFEEACPNPVVHEVKRWRVWATLTAREARVLVGWRGELRVEVAVWSAEREQWEWPGRETEGEVTLPTHWQQWPAGPGMDEEA